MFPKRSEEVALIADERQLNYSELVDSIHSYSTLFDCKPGDRIIIFSENRMEWIIAYYAIWQQSAVPVPVDFMSSAEDLAYIINDCTPAVIFCSENLLPVLQEALEGTRTIPKVNIFEKIEEKPVTGAANEFPEIRKDDTAVIIYTSGTTGSPKGVMLSYDNLLSNIEGVTEDVKIYNEKDRVMILLPLHHIFPLMGSMIAPLHVNGTVAISPSLNPEDIIKTLAENEITLVIGVPRFYNLIRKGIIDKINQSAIARLLFFVASKLQSRKFSKKIFRAVHQKFGGHIRYLVCGGAALDTDTARDFLTLGFEVLEGYGMTETAPMITFTRPGNYIPGSGGQALKSTTIEIRDGEIVASGRNVMKGYYNRPEETAEVLKKGWMHTGDLGRIDENGFVYITGRKKEIIVLSNGKNINPQPLEQKIISKTPYVLEAGVFLQGDHLQALVVPDLHRMKYDGIEDYNEYIRWEVIDKLNKAATPYKRIRKFHLVTEELPKTRLGKLQRYRFAEIAGGLNKQREYDAPEPDYKEYRIIRDYLEQETGSKVFPNDHLEMDVALDSLSRVTLLVFIENTFGVKIPEEDFMKYPTVLKLSTFVQSQKTRSSIELVNWGEILREKVRITLPRSRYTITFFNTLSKVLLNLYFRLRSNGRSNIPEGPCIIAPNHQSFLDGFFVTSLLRLNMMKNTYVYAKEKHWRKGWLQFMARKNNVILMDINKDLKLSLQKMAEALKIGKNIIIFPEGTRSKTGQPGSFKKSFAILSQELNVPVIPVAINGSYSAMPAGAWLPRPFRKIFVEFLQPVYPANHNYDSLTALVQNRVENRLSGK